MLLPSTRGIALAALALAATASAGTLAVPFHRRPAPAASVTRRDGTLHLEALNNITGGGYFAELGVGTPPQKLSFLVDTGSSDTWVNSVDADLCRSPQAQQRLDVWCGPQCEPPLPATMRSAEALAVQSTPRPAPPSRPGTGAASTSPTSMERILGAIISTTPSP